MSIRPIKAHNAFIFFSLINKRSYLITYAGILSCIADKVYLISVLTYFIIIAKTHYKERCAAHFSSKNSLVSSVWYQFSETFWQICSYEVVAVHFKPRKNILYIFWNIIKPTHCVPLNQMVRKSVITGFSSLLLTQSLIYI